MFILIFRVPVPSAFVALSCMVVVPTAVGVPVIAPPEDSERPFGSAPDEIENVYGPVPPLALTF